MNSSESISDHIEPITIDTSIRSLPPPNKKQLFPHPRRLSRSSSEPMKNSSSGNNVKFHQIEIREYEQILSDNPSVSCGPPLGLGWGYNDPAVYSVEEYETHLKPNRRERSEMIMPREVREGLLQDEWAVQKEEIVERMREIKHARQQRRTTIRNTDQLERVIHVWSSMGRKLKRVVFETNKERRLRKILSKTRRRVISMNDLTGGHYELDDSLNGHAAPRQESDSLHSCECEDEDKLRGFNDTFQIVYANKTLKKKIRRGSLFRQNSDPDSDCNPKIIVGHELDATRAHHDNVLVIDDSDSESNSTDPLKEEDDENDENKRNSPDDKKMSPKGNANTGEKEDKDDWNSDDIDSDDFFNPPPIEVEKFVSHQGGEEDENE